MNEPMNNDMTITVRPDEFALLTYMRRFKGEYADFKVEMRDGRIVRLLPTFSILLKDIDSQNKNDVI